MRLYIDCGVKAGRTAKRDALIPYGVSELRREMERCGVHAAVVESANAADYSFIHGNRDLLDICHSNPRLFPLATCPPTYRWETEEGAGYLTARLDEGVRGMMVRPGPLRHELDTDALGPSIEVLLSKDLPLVLYGDDSVFPGLGGILASFPKLKVLLLYTSYASTRRLFPLLDKYQNLYTDLGGNQANDLVDIVAKHFGVQRIVYTSGYPGRCMAGLKPLVEYSELCETDKDLVAHGNACALFRIDKNMLLPYDSCHMDDLERAMTAGKPLTDWKVYDIHAHIMDAKDQTATVMMFNSDAGSIAKKAARLGVQKIAVSAWEGLYGGGEHANKTVCQAMQDYPDLFVGYATANPNYEDCIPEAIQYHGRKGFIGIKPYAQLQGRKFNDPVYAPWFEDANTRRFVMKVHSGDQATADQIDDIAPLYPDITFLMAHSGASFEAARINTALAKKHGNVMLELTFTAMTRGSIEYMVNELGSERIFYGSDLPMRDPGPQLAWVVFSEIPFEDKLNILGRNMERLLRRVFPDQG